MSTNNERAVRALCKFIERHQDVEILGFVACNKSGYFLVWGTRSEEDCHRLEDTLLYILASERLATKEIIRDEDGDV
jgi:hypothetical protein